MPPKTVSVKAVDPKQGSIQLLFKKPAAAAPTTAAAAIAPIAASADAVATATASTVYGPTLTSEDPFVSEFYASLSSRERIAHTIAVEKLGTSYDVKRTHGFQKWLKSRK